MTDLEHQHNIDDAVSAIRKATNAIRANGDKLFHGRDILPDWRLDRMEKAAKYLEQEAEGLRLLIEKLRARPALQAEAEARVQAYINGGRAA